MQTTSWTIGTFWKRFNHFYTENSNKNVYIVGDFNLNFLDHNLNEKVQNCLNFIYQSSFIPTLNKPTRVTRKTSTIIDHILTNSFVNTNFKTFIFKIDISDHFPICFLQPTSRPRTKLHILLKESSTITQSKLCKTSWDNVINNKNPNDARSYILHKLIVLYDKFFAKTNTRIYKERLTKQLDN